MKESEVFLVSEGFENKIKAQDFYDNFVPDKQHNIVESFEIHDELVYVTLTDFSYTLGSHYSICEIYINNNCVQFNKDLNFRVKKYTKIENKKPELIIYIELQD